MVSGHAEAQRPAAWDTRVRTPAPPSDNGIPWLWGLILGGGVLVVAVLVARSRREIDDESGDGPA